MVMSIKLLNDEYYSYDELVENLSNERVGYKQKFCRFLHDICLLKNNDSSVLFKNLNGDEFVENETIEKYYNTLKHRLYYFYLFNFIYLNYTADDVRELGKELDDRALEEEIYEDAVWETTYTITAQIVGYLEAAREYYDFLTNKKSSVKKYLNAELIEEQCNILKEDVERKGFKYLTYNRNVNSKLTDDETKKRKKISHSTRLRIAEKDTTEIYAFQKEQQQDRDIRLKNVMQDYYDCKRKNNKLTINQYLESNKTVSKRTFFNYKKVYDQKFLGKNKLERAYQAYLDELMKDSNFRITADFVSKFKVSISQLKQYIDEMDAEG